MTAPAPPRRPVVQRGSAEAAVVAGGVCLARVEVGSHRPPDVVGGAGPGLAVAGVVRFRVGRPV